MPLRFNFCPICNEKITFKSCKKLSTFYVDSLLRVSYKELDKKPGGIKTIETS